MKLAARSGRYSGMDAGTYPVEMVRAEVDIEDGRMARVVEHFRITGGPRAGLVLRFVSAQGTYSVENPAEPPVDG